MKKQKRAQKFVTYIIIGIFGCVILGLATFLIAFAIPSQDQYAGQSLATAEYLDQYPASIPAFIRIDDMCRDGADHCFWIPPELVAGSLYAPSLMRHLSETLVVTINGIVQANISPLLVETQLYVALPIRSNGLNLVEVQIEDYDGRIYRHAWSVRHDGEAISAPPTLAIPPTFTTAMPETAD